MKLLIAVPLFILVTSCVTVEDVEYRYAGDKDLTENQIDRKLSRDLSTCEANSKTVAPAGYYGGSVSMIDDDAVDDCMYGHGWDVTVLKN